MKTKIALPLVAVLLAALAWTFVKRPLSVPKTMGPALPPAALVDGVSFSVIAGADMKSQQGFSVRGGSLTKSFISGLAAFMIEHPQGRLLIDAGVAREVRQHLETTPLLLRILASLAVKQPTIDALAARGLGPGDLRAIVLTHSHWDHVSGLADLRDVPVWITAEELAHARSEDEGGKLYRQLEAEDPLQLHDLAFIDDAYGPFAASHDFFGDGSVVIVPMPGHTPGSVAVFVNLPSGKRFLIIGDTSWTKEGVDWPAEKPWLARRMVDFDAAGVREQLVLLHQLQRANPDLTIVPAHDARVHATIAAF
ncbi:MAG: MBL fold metallo-hydrolase [Deltaproteobacteria bacterium]|nr:MBL fold metallo-hydrolase [Deltaproteobacteria bacterium]MBW2550032.1 MBL fold metallo-hydrolase [Deltaproteobacteria bacterium]MBW2626902.1 MBL fold metallo-hydrolase [Deltaproteobacteria bacterium]MBW2684754.1 MBL fold metallo-hydrolase [Deltaproteobacteria bacterium]